MEDKSNGNYTLGDFKEWVNASKDLLKESEGKWSEALDKSEEKSNRVKKWLIIVLALTNAFWAAVLGIFIAFAYLTPETTTQEQDFTSQNQKQSTDYTQKFEGSDS